MPMVKVSNGGSITPGDTVTFVFGMVYYFSYSSTVSFVLPKEVMALLKSAKTITWSSTLPVHPEFPQSTWRLYLTGATTLTINYNSTGTISSIDPTQDLNIRYYSGAANGGGNDAKLTVNFIF